MELSWPIKLRIAGAAAVGILLIGILAWPIVAPPDPFAGLSLITGAVTVTDAVILLALAFLAGLIAYFLTWPYGRHIAVLAAPAGLAVWAMRTGSMADLVQRNHAPAARQHLLNVIRFEPFFWLAVVAAGFAAVLVAHKLCPAQDADNTAVRSRSRRPQYVLFLIAFAASVALTEFFVGIFAADVAIPDSRLGSVTGQPPQVQIAFALLVSFGLVAFVAKRFLSVGYIVPVAASAFLTAFSVTFYTKTDLLKYLCDHWPAAFFHRPVLSILPLQMVAFGTLGALAGYWLAIRYDYWRQHENKGHKDHR